jgi:integrase
MSPRGDISTPSWAKAWRKAGLERITPHEARHVCASILIASGLNAKVVSVLMGQSSIAITFDTYGHLFEGSEAEAAELVGAYLRPSRGGLPSG